MTLMDDVVGHSSYAGEDPQGASTDEFEGNEPDENNESNDEKREKFIKLAEPRVSAAIKKIRLIGNLSNRSSYKYDTDQVQQIIDVLEAEIGNLKSKFKEEDDIVVFSFKK